MEITENGGCIPLNRYVRTQRDCTRGKTVSGEAQKPIECAADTVDLSDKVGEIHRAQNRLAVIPDVREEKVAELRQKIAGGTYEIDSERIAGKMLADALAFGLQTEE